MIHLKHLLRLKSLTHCALAWLFILLAQTPAWSAAVDSMTPYPVGDDEQTSSVFSVRVNGVTVPVYHCADMNYVHFAFTGTAQVVVTVSQNISTYDLSPHADALAPQISGNEMRFSIDRPRKVILHNPHDAYVEKLCIFADAPEENPPKPGDARVTTLTGLDASGSTDETTRLQAAVDGMPEGNTLYIPAGRYTFTYL